MLVNTPTHKGVMTDRLRTSGLEGRENKRQKVQK